MSELSVENANGEIRVIYETIEAALGVRLVNLVYRHLATVPGALEWAWYTVGEPFRAGVFAERSKALLPVVDRPPRRRISLISAELPLEEARQVLATLDAYNRANPMNAVSLRVIALALEAGRPAAPLPVTPPSVTTPSHGDLPGLLPMGSLDSLDPDTMALMHRLARLTSGRESKIVPSLFRHFAAWPSLLEQMADWMEEFAGGTIIDEQAAHIFAMADRIACDIYAALPAPGANAILPGPKTRRTLVETIEIFPPTICRMIVIAGLLRSALSLDTEAHWKKDGE